MHSSEYSTKSATDQVHLDIIDDTLGKRYTTLESTFSANNNPCKQKVFVKDSRTIVGIEDTNFASNFQFDEHYENIDNTLCIPTYKILDRTAMFYVKQI